MSMTTTIKPPAERVDSRPMCESCRLVPATVKVSWPDADFATCVTCVPADLMAKVNGTSELLLGVG